MLKVLTVVGARPQIIKASAISRAIRQFFSTEIQEIIVHTGQHYDENMSNVFFEELGIPSPDYNLNVGSGSHGTQTARMIEGIEQLLVKESPDYMILYGDTNSTLAGAVAASKLNIPIAHVEAGLRSFNRRMPEEINRVVCDHLSTLLFSPTKSGIKNLLVEGFQNRDGVGFTPEKPGCFHCGDVMYDNSQYFAGLSSEKSNVLTVNNLEINNFVLVTLHRDHNTDVPENLDAIFSALIEISKEIKLILPVHPRTRNKLLSKENRSLVDRIEQADNLFLIDPVSFLDMIELERNASIIITDSGGVQKEAYFFNKPCIIMRPETEWLEILDTGKAVLAAADRDKIVQSFKLFKESNASEFPKIFGDGKAAEFICQKLINN